jgi:hypothetical protein
VLNSKALDPTATFRLPVILNVIAPAPRDVLNDPVVCFNSEFVPKALLQLVSFAAEYSAQLPNTELLLPTFVFVLLLIIYLWFYILYKIIVYCWCLFN